MKSDKWIRLLRELGIWLDEGNLPAQWPVNFLLPKAESNHTFKWYGPPDAVTEDYLMYLTPREHMYFLWENVQGLKVLKHH